MARSVLGFFLFYGRMGCPDFDGPELLHVACSIAKCLTKIWGDGFRNFLNGEVSNLLKDYFFSQYWGENLQWYSTVQWSRVACLQMFENVFIVGYILFFFFFNLSFTFYLVGGNILSLLSNVNPQNSSASVFTRVYTHERGYREQRILVVRNTKSQCIETDRLERSRRVSDNASNFLRPGRNFRVSGLTPVRFRVQAINSWVRSSSQKND